MRTQPLTPDLLAATAALEQAVFAEPWSAQALGLLCGETAFGVAVVEDGQVLAYGGMMTVLDEGQVTNIATHPDHRRRGLGRLVLAALLEQARARGLVEVTLEVRESNLPAIALYSGFGFEQVGYRPRFYSHPVEAALIMRCQLC